MQLLPNNLSKIKNLKFVADLMCFLTEWGAEMKDEDKKREQLISDLKEARQQSEEKIKFSESKYKSLFNGTKTILEDADFQTTARKLFDICSEQIGGKSGYVALLDEEGQENEVLFLEAGGLPCTVDPNLPMPIRGLRAEAYQHGKVVYDNDFSNSQWMEYMPEGHVTLKNVLFSPLIINEKTVGIMGIANKDEDFTEDDVEVAEAFGELAAIALKNSQTRDELRKNEEKLIQTQKMQIVGTLAGGVAHEFNNLLQIISGYAWFLRESITDDVGKDTLDTIGKACDRGKYLVKQLSIFSRPGTKQLKPFSLHSLVEEAVNPSSPV